MSGTFVHCFNLPPEPRGCLETRPSARLGKRAKHGVSKKRYLAVPPVAQILLLFLIKTEQESGITRSNDGHCSYEGHLMGTYKRRETVFESWVG
jgi:hypothetical protein